MSDDTAILETPASPDIEIEEIDKVIIRFAGDSGDGMQLAGTRFTADSAIFGNDLATLPELPCGDPGSGRHHSWCFVVPGSDCRFRHPDARRRGRRPGDHEPGRAQGKPR